MEKVYQIKMYECDEYDHVQCILGIFTDKEVAEGIVSKFNKDMENKLKELYAKQDELDKDDDKKYKYKDAFYSPYTDEYLEIDYEIRNLQRISYDIKEIIINQLYN
jgi:hypothetical protein